MILLLLQLFYVASQPHEQPTARPPPKVDSENQVAAREGKVAGGKGLSKRPEAHNLMRVATYRR